MTKIEGCKHLPVSVCHAAAAIPPVPSSPAKQPNPAPSARPLRQLGSYHSHRPRLKASCNKNVRWWNKKCQQKLSAIWAYLPRCSGLNTFGCMHRHSIQLHWKRVISWPVMLVCRLHRVARRHQVRCAQLHRQPTACEQVFGCDSYDSPLTSSTSRITLGRHLQLAFAFCDLTACKLVSI
jgi:hypothetical protein